jgi:Ca-activated chloride channel family protein
MHAFRWGLILALLLSPLRGGEPGQDEPTIHASVDVVDVLCTVQDRRKRYLSNLTRDDFEIYEDGVKQNIDFFHHETGEKARPLSVLMLVDTSGSVKDKLHFEQEAASEFLRQTMTQNKDMAAVVQFDSEINLAQDFTFDIPLLEEALLKMRAGGATKLYDAIWVGVKDLLSEEVGRKVLVILSDGADTQSTIEAEEAIKTSQINDVVIYGIGVKSRRFDSDFGQLKKFSRATGGRFYNSKVNLKRLHKAFSQISKEIKNQYSLGYVSSNKERDGSFRSVEVRVKRRGLKLNHREGYYAPVPTS